jgi:hypothetical protein
MDLPSRIKPSKKSEIKTSSPLFSTFPLYRQSCELPVNYARRKIRENNCNLYIWITIVMDSDVHYY